LEQRLRVAFRDKLRLLTVAARDPATLPPSTRVLLKRREVAEVERELQNQRQEFQQRMQRLAQRRQQLARRQEQHRDAVLRFESLLKVRSAGQHGTGERRVLRCHPACPQAPWRGHPSQPPPTAQFQDVPAMLGHFGVLAAVRAALARQAEAGQQLLAHGRAELQRYRQESSRQLLGTRDELARLHTRLEAARQDVLQWESCWANIQSTAAQKTLLLGQIKLAVLNLFQQTTAQLRIPTDRAQEDTKAQLDMVLLCMQGLADICATGTRPQHHRSTRLLQGQE
ncbi:CC42M protein, partial [Thryothorus ludovicianus]|nr:CC42M protein [Thryothorus ludovicianus]